MSGYDFSSSSTTTLNDIDIDHEKDVEKLRAACKELVSENANLKNNPRMEWQNPMMNLGILFPSMWKMDMRMQSARSNFYDKKRMELSREHPGAAYNQLGRLADPFWNRLSEQEKLTYASDRETSRDTPTTSSANALIKNNVIKASTNQGKATSIRPKATSKSPSPFVIFVNKKRPELRAAHPNASFGEIGKMITEMWSKMSEQDKSSYTTERLETSPGISSTTTSSVNATVNNRSLEPRNDVLKASTNPGKVSDGKPKIKRAPSPYIIFCTKKRPEVRAAHPNASFAEMGAMLGKLWSNLTEQEKSVYRLESRSRQISSQQPESPRSSASNDIIEL